MPSSPVELVEPSIDPEEIRKALSILMSPGSWYELSGTNTLTQRVCSTTINGNDLDAAMELVDKFKGMNIRLSINTVKPEFSTINNNAFHYRHWILINVNAVRQNNTHATEAEKRNSRIVAAKIQFHLHYNEWPRPIVIDSGNGWNLLYRINLLNTYMLSRTIRGLLENISSKFDNQHATIDLDSYTVRRSVRLPGTINYCRFSDTGAPYRRARVVWKPDLIETVEPDKIYSVSGFQVSKLNRYG